jgi:hypothetical protein
MLPNFLVIGAQKAGSSWFSEGLGEHPDIFVAPREGHFFNDHFDRGVAWYESLFESADGRARVGEGTPGYIYHPEAPRRIREVLGADVKLIACLRHPVTRAYSAFWNALTSGDLEGDLDFATYLPERDDFGIRTRGFYFEQLSRVLEQFPRENLLVFVQEEDLSRGAETMRRCYEFLGVDSDFTPTRASVKANANQDFRFGHAQIAGVGRAVARSTALFPKALRDPLRSAYLRAFDLLPRRRTYSKLDPSVRNELLSLYRADILQLEELLGRDLSVWN